MNQGQWFSRAQFAFEGKAAGIDRRSVFQVRQVHGDRVFELTAASSREVVDADAIVTRVPGAAIGIRTADCVPILLAHPSGVVAAVHAGWRGTQARILEKTLRFLQEEYGCDLASVKLVIGPAIGACCYEVGEEVARNFQGAAAAPKPISPGKFLLDLPELNAGQARENGIREENLTVFPYCTRCLHGEYFSYRWASRQGVEETGRNLSWIVWNS